MTRRLIAGLAIAAALIAPLDAHAQTPPCEFVLGFAAFHERLPDVVGNCLDDQSTALNGDALQRTTKGLLVWRKDDNWTAFTDGYNTWLVGPYGLAERLNTQRFAWEADFGRQGLTAAPPEPAAAGSEQADREAVLQLVHASVEAFNSYSWDPMLGPAPATLGNYGTFERTDQLHQTLDDAQVISWNDGRVVVQMTRTTKSLLPNPPLTYRPQRETRKVTLIKTPGGWRIAGTLLMKLDYLD